MSKSRRQHSSKNQADLGPLDGSITSNIQTEDLLSLDISTVKKGRSRTTAVVKKAKQTNLIADPTNDDVARDTNRRNLGKGKKKQPVTIGEISQHSASNAEEADEDDLSKKGEAEIDTQLVKPARKVAGRTKSTKDPPIKSRDNNDDSVKEQKLSSGQQMKRKGRPKKVISSTRSHDKVIDETQEPELEILDEVGEDIVEIPNSQIEVPELRNICQTTHQHQACIESDQDTDSGTILKQKIEDITRKYENLQTRYNQMKELGIKKAEKNFDDLQKHTEERNRIANDYLASLQADLKKKSSLATENKSLKKKNSAANAEILSLKAQIQKLESSLLETQAENKTLSTKLSASRTAVVSVDGVSSNIPGSVIKVNGGIRMVGTAEAALAAQVAQLKEDMYSDLTGLLMRSVTRGSEKDCFDCIQTGRNGTLHFKLAVGNEKSAESYDDIQCSYTPLLDSNRDRMLIELLPDYLADEITFPRPHAAKFYARVVKALTEKPA